MKPAQGKKRVIHEVVKDLHTSHWDLDMLSWSELEALMRAEQPPAVTGHGSEEIGNETASPKAQAKTPPTDSTA